MCRMDGMANSNSKMGPVQRALHSIRTQYSLATACFLLLVLGVFYVGGRIVLVHMERDTIDPIDANAGYRRGRLIVVAVPVLVVFWAWVQQRQGMARRAS